MKRGVIQQRICLQSLTARLELAHTNEVLSYRLIHSYLNFAISSVSVPGYFNRYCDIYRSNFALTLSQPKGKSVPTEKLKMGVRTPGLSSHRRLYRVFL